MSDVDIKELKKNFAAYKTAEKAVAGAEKALAAARAKLSTTVEAIHETGGKGPFSFEGKELTVVSRKKKDSDEVTWFMRGQTQRETISI